MVNENEIIPLMLEACPSVKDKWQEHLDWWDSEDAGLYNDITVFAHQIVECYEEDRKAEIKAIFDVIETLINNGNEDVQGIAIVGFLESLQNIASGKDYGYKIFEPYLQASSRQAWIEIEELWKGKNSLADVIRSLNQNN